MKISDNRTKQWTFPYWKSMKSRTICVGIFFSACYNYIIKQEKEKQS